MAERSPVPGDTDAGAVPRATDAGRTPPPLPEAAQEAPEAPEATGRATSLPTHVPRSVRSLLWQARVGAGLAILFAVIAAVLYVQADGLRSAAADREAVLEAGQIMALRVTTFDGATIDEWVADTQRLATGTYAEEVAALFEPEVRQGLAVNEVQSVGELTSSFVQDVDGDRATVFSVLRQTFTSNAQPQPISDELRMEIALQRVDGRWLASEVAILGPSIISPVADDGLAPPPDGGLEPPADVAPPADGAAEEDGS
jgi:Mce-associated membrane protein